MNFDGKLVAWLFVLGVVFAVVLLVLNGFIAPEVSVVKGGNLLNVFS